MAESPAVEAIQIPQQLQIQPLPMEVVTGATKAKTFALAIVVNDQETFEDAANEVALIKGRWNSIEALRDSFVRPLNETVKKINAFFKVPLDDLEAAEKTIKATMLTYRKAEEEKAEQLRKEQAAKAERERQEQERKAREIQAQKDAEEQRRRDAEERLRKEKEEQERRQAEAHQRELDARRAGDEEAERKAKAEREEAERKRKATEKEETEERARAEKARLEGEQKSQDLIEAARAIQSAPPVNTAPPKAAGTSARKKWKAEVTNKLEFIKCIAEGKAPLSLVEVDEGALNRMAQAADGELNYAGVRPYEADSLSVKAKS